MIKGFRDFVMRGNVVDLAVAVVIGAALTTVINALVEHLVTPLIAALFGEPNLDQVLTFAVNNAEFSIGAILTALINFTLVASAVYFFVIVPMNTMRQRHAKGEEQAEPAEAVTLLREIRDLLAQREPR